MEITSEMEERVKSAVATAMVRFHTEHVALLEVDASEKSITHKFAQLLEQELHRVHLADWDVDCEYNRHGKNSGRPKEITAIRSQFLEFAKNLTKNEALDLSLDPDSHGSQIFPDIIVHRRTLPMNLLVIEAKKRRRIFVSQGLGRGQT